MGLLNSAVGARAIAGSALTVLLVGRRLVVPIVIGFACWSLALARWRWPPRGGRAGPARPGRRRGILTEVAGRLLLQRSAPTRS